MNASDPENPVPAKKPVAGPAAGSSKPVAGLGKIFSETSHWFRTLPALPLLAGVALGFIACCLAGRIVAERKLFQNFVRFFVPIQPQTLFYPTASELLAHIRQTVPKTKVLVLVGGASYFRGTGQNADELWTLELQRLLGERYGVVNFAIDQAGIPDFAGAMMRILAREYPKLIYVCNGSPRGEGSVIDGGEVYRYVFWDAYYKGLFGNNPVWLEQALRQAHLEKSTADGLELHLGKWIDAQAYACDLWTTIGYERFFTVWSDTMVKSPFQARKLYRDINYPAYADVQKRVRADEVYAANNEKGNKAFAQAGFERSATGELESVPGYWSAISSNFESFYPPDLRSKVLVVLVRGNPYFMRSFTAEDRQRYEMTYKTSAQVIEHLGYFAIQGGADCTPDDYIDSGHFMASGGRKVARAVALKVQQIFAAEK